MAKRAKRRVEAVKLYDVVAVLLTAYDDAKQGTVRLIAESKTKDNAEAIHDMAIMRRGVDREFFSVVAHGAYREGDKWTGPNKRPRRLLKAAKEAK